MRAMPVRLCLLGLTLLLLPSNAMARTITLEPRIGMEALLLNCVLYDPSCLKAPAGPIERMDAVVEAQKAAVARAPSAAPEDPETTGSVLPR